MRPGLFSCRPRSLMARASSAKWAGGAFTRSAASDECVQTESEQDPQSYRDVGDAHSYPRLLPREEVSPEEPRQEGRDAEPETDVRVIGREDHIRDDDGLPVEPAWGGGDEVLKGPLYADPHNELLQRRVDGVHDHSQHEESEVEWPTGEERAGVEERPTLHGGRPPHQAQLEQEKREQ